MPNKWLPIALLLTSTSVLPGGEPTAPGNDSIRHQDLKADLYFLAGDAFRGRLTATPENDLASQFVASRFERLGLRRIGDDASYFHRFRLSTATLGPANLLEVVRDGANVTLRHPFGQAFAPHRFSPSGEAKGPLTFVGFGIHAPELGHDDYARVDVRGSVVLALDHEPGETDPASPFDGVITSEAALPLRKTLTAQERGAIGILFVSDAHNHHEPESFEAGANVTWPEKPPRIPMYTLQDWVERVRIPAGTISRALARTLLEGTGRTLEDLGRAAEKPSQGGRLQGLEATSVRLTTDVRRHVVPDRNVVAAVEGSDPMLRDEYVIISSHHDHDGADGAQVLNGADDNASGTVGLIEIAEAYALAAARGERPRRSILFASFNSEERGLLGSWAFVERPPFPLEHIAAVLNMDMVGRDEEVPPGGGPRFRGLPAQSAESNRNAVNLMGYSRSEALARAIERANVPFGLTLKRDYDNNPSNLLRRSDQWPFLHKGIPAVFFHTGLHPDYHTAGDRPEKINYPKMERIVRLVHQASWDLAQDTGRPRMTRRAPGARDARTGPVTGTP